jgi:hypothetical protein
MELEVVGSLLIIKEKLIQKSKVKTPNQFSSAKALRVACLAAALLHWHHVHSPHPHHRVKRPGSLALASLACTVGSRLTHTPV